MKQLHELRPGESTTIGRRIYGCCTGCGGIVWTNKPIVGSLHICAETREERYQREAQIECGVLCVKCNYSGPIGSRCNCQ